MKTTIHTLTSALLLTLSAQAGAIRRVHTQEQKATIDAQVGAGEELRLFVGEESIGWSSSGPKAAGFKATVEASTRIPLEGGLFGKGFVFKAGGTFFVAMNPDGPVPLGELVFRENGKVSAKDGAYTFADIWRPDGTFVPVSVRIRSAQPQAN